jgi:hypothetical protein
MKAAKLFRMSISIPWQIIIQVWFAMFERVLLQVLLGFQDVTLNYMNLGITNIVAGLLGGHLFDQVE